jgi:membrane protein
MTRPSSNQSLAARFAWDLAAAIGRHDLASRAAAITFYAFFSLFPFILLTIYLASMVVPTYRVEQVLTDILGPYFPEMEDAQRFIHDHVSSLAVVGEKIGLFSVLTLMWSAMSGFLAVQQAMDAIWERQQRSFFARQVVSFLMVMVLLLVILCTVVGMALAPALEYMSFVQSGPLSWLTWLQGWSRTLFPLSLFVSFAICYRYLPARRTPWNCVLPGAMTATLLLDLGRNIFVWYASHLVRYQMIYGGLAAVMLLVFWMYIGGIVLLFGAEIAAALERASSDSP